MPVGHMNVADPPELDDPFAGPGELRPGEEDPERITGGRYRLPDLEVRRTHASAVPELLTGEGSRKGGWQRVTTLVKAIGDARALDLWHQRKLIYGMVVRPDLYDLACGTIASIQANSPTPEADLKRALEDLAGRILAAAGADEGANLGTAFHGFTEAQDLGMIHYARKRWHGKLRNYADGMQAQKLEVIREYVERRVVVLRYGLCGTLDRILLDQVTGAMRIGDLKSQKTFWTWLEIAAQLSAYAMADAMWDRARLRYVEMPPVAQDLAVVSWMPVAHPAGAETGVEALAESVDWFDVDLEKGRRALEECYRVDRLRSEAKSAGQTWGTLRPMPELGRVETYARRLDSVSSLAEGSALWAEITAQGLSGDQALSSLAAEIAQRFVPRSS